MKVHEVMTRSVAYVQPDTPVADAAGKMKLLDIGFLPVYENDQLIGAITDRDITIRCVADGLDAKSTETRDIMTPDAFYCFDDQDLEEVGREMQKKEVKRMLILTRDHKLSGVVSLGDIAKATGEQRLAGETLKEISEAA